MLVNINTLSTVSDYTFRSQYKNTSFPAPLTDAILTPYGHAILNTITLPAYDSWTHTVTEGTPEQREDTKWYQTWVLTPVERTEEEITRRFTDAKSSKLAEINNRCQQALAALTPTYPERELTTFDKQEAEARAYTKDPATAVTPFLSALAAARGIALDLLVQKVIAKADAFALASGHYIGQRQALEDLLDLATTYEDVQGITVSYALPTQAE